ncbi:CvpA family protein [Candidatus Pandoraea novymonadis]|uniref:Colicin V production protein n=1 Tax=Candidatus Pandoraea novymonadis TaxID=1808959 RepID=A0ABX5FER2_9BURK|nr:CvpA family protein [Candidatus Pandoraea novymonadis]PSB92196.1 Colicin V production protein [Candidatus Pandoraea novymonadis]
MNTEILTGVDYVVIFILLGSVLLGMLRGIIREIFSLVGWVVAFFVARVFGGTVAQWLPVIDFPNELLTQGGFGFLLVFLTVLFSGGIISALIGRIINVIGLRTIDRGLGMLFGMVRGIVILMILLVGATFTELPQKTMWRNSVLLPLVEVVINQIRPWLPEAILVYV